MNATHRILAAAVLAATLASPAASATSYAIVDIGSLAPDSIFTMPQGINNQGQVTGQSALAGLPESGVFLYSSGTMTNIGTLPGPTVYPAMWASGINLSGAITGYAVRSDQSMVAFLYRDATITDLGNLGPQPDFPYGTAAALGLNDNGQVVGYSETGGQVHAFLYSGSVMRDLAPDFPAGVHSVATAINNLGQVAVRAGNLTDACAHAFVDDAGVVTAIPSLSCMDTPTAINENGQVVGMADLPFGGLGRAFLYDNGVTRDLGKLPNAVGAGATGINEAGQVVGISAMSFYVWDSRAFLYQNGTMTDLNDLLPAGSDWTLLGAQAINDKGQIVGYGRHAVPVSGNPEEVRGFLMTPVAADTVPPVLSLPGTITTNATSPAGAVVTYLATAQDAVDPNPTISCTPASGSMFSVGTTSVSCMATDASGNSAAGTFDVIVLGAAQQTASLSALVTSYGLPAGITTSLVAKLNAALADFAAGNVALACSDVTAFINAVEAQSGKKISAAQAAALISAANGVRAAMGCA